MKKNESGSILIWILIAILVVGLGVGGWYLYRSKPTAVPVVEDTGFTTVVEEPSPSPDYSLVQQKYGLNQQQIDILSHVVTDDGSKL